jgi:hypothetical protein
MGMHPVRESPPFTPLFDRSAALCVEAQSLLRRSASAVARARELRIASDRSTALVQEGRTSLAVANLLFSTLRSELACAVQSMRDAGLDEPAAAASVRARIRFVLYDGGFRESEAEPVVDRATGWVRELFQAA